MTKRPISKSRTAVRALIFVLIAALGIGLISPMLVANNDWDKRHVHGFFLEPEDSLDVVLIGASQLYTGYSAPLAWQQYGYTSYPLTVSNIPARLYGSLLTEAVDRQHPKLIVVDIDGFINDENPETLEANLRKWIDNIPWSRNRLETIRTCVPRELQTSFYFNIAIPCQLVPGGKMGAGAAASAHHGRDRLLADQGRGDGVQVPVCGF